MAPVGVPFSEPKCLRSFELHVLPSSRQVSRKHTQEEDIDMRSLRFYGAFIPP